MIRFHDTSVTIEHTIPPHVEPGAELTITVSASCPVGCNLSGQRIQIATGNGPLVESELLAPPQEGCEQVDPAADESSEERAAEAPHDFLDVPVATTAPFVVHAPKDAGEHVLKIRFPNHQHEDTGSIHRATIALVPVNVGLHKTSMAVWGVPAPLTCGCHFTATIGVQCTASCRLTGQTVQVLDQTGAVVGEGTLGEAPLPGTPGLYWAEVALSGPAAEGISQWVASFVHQGLDVPHESARANFSFRTNREPEHILTVNVISKDTQAPVDNVEVRADLYEAFTDDHGTARIAVPKGSYRVTIRKDGVVAYPAVVDVQDDLTLQVDAETTLTRLEREKSHPLMLEDYPWV